MAEGDKLVNLDGLKAVYDKTNGDITDLKSTVNHVYLTDSYSTTKYGIIYHAFDFVAGHTYKLTNGTSSTANAYTFSEASSSGSQVEVIKENWSAGNTITFTPTQNASAIKTFSNNAGTITIIDVSIGMPKLEDDVDDLQDDVTDLQGNFRQIEVANTYGPTSDLFTFTESKYAGGEGYRDSNQYDSWEFTASQNLSIYMANIGSTSAGIYMQLCVYPSGSFNDPDFVRYRSSDSNLPSSASPLSVTSGTKLIISTNKDNSTWRYVITTMVKSLSENIMLDDAQIMQASNMYYATYTSGVLHVEGNGINCDFSDLDFNSSHGVFELQNLIYNNAVIFDTVNDYLGPVRVHGESIKGAKHGEETSDSVRIIADGVTLSSGDAVCARQITIYVESTIDTDEFKRYTVWTLNSRGLLLDTILVTLKALNIDYVFGAGIISCQDNVNIAWINKEKLSSNVLTGLNESTAIVTTGGTLFSHRVSVNSAYGDQRVAFTTYTGRKKLYYYTCYGSDISVPSGAVFASCAELEFM